MDVSDIAQIVDAITASAEPLSADPLSVDPLGPDVPPPLADYLNPDDPILAPPDFPDLPLPSPPRSQLHHQLPLPPHPSLSLPLPLPPPSHAYHHPHPHPHPHAHTHAHILNHPSHIHPVQHHNLYPYPTAAAPTPPALVPPTGHAATPLPPSAVASSPFPLHHHHHHHQQQQQQQLLAPPPPSPPPSLRVGRIKKPAKPTKRSRSARRATHPRQRPASPPASDVSSRALTPRSSSPYLVPSPPLAPSPSPQLQLHLQGELSLPSASPHSVKPAGSRPPPPPPLSVHPAAPLPLAPLTATAATSPTHHITQSQPQQQAQQNQQPPQLNRGTRLPTPAPTTTTSAAAAAAAAAALSTVASPATNASSPKSHTRRCREKVSRQFERLIDALPPAPHGVEVKHKAQVLDHTLSTLRTLIARRDHLRSSLALSSPDDLRAWLADRLPHGGFGHGLHRNNTNMSNSNSTSNNNSNNSSNDSSNSSGDSGCDKARLLVKQEQEIHPAESSASISLSNVNHHQAPPASIAKPAATPQRRMDLRERVSLTQLLSDFVTLYATHHGWAYSEVWSVPQDADGPVVLAHANVHRNSKGTREFAAKSQATYGAPSDIGKKKSASPSSANRSSTPGAIGGLVRRTLRTQRTQRQDDLGADVFAFQRAQLAQRAGLRIAEATPVMFERGTMDALGAHHVRAVVVLMGCESGTARGFVAAEAAAFAAHLRVVADFHERYDVEYNSNLSAANSCSDEHTKGQMRSRGQGRGRARGHARATQARGCGQSRSDAQARARAQAQAKAQAEAHAHAQAQAQALALAHSGTRDDWKFEDGEGVSIAATVAAAAVAAAAAAVAAGTAPQVQLSAGPSSIPHLGGGSA